MENKQMTSVEWLEKQLYEWAGGRFYFPPHFFEEAKEMEKQQIIDAYRDGRSDQQSEKASRFYNRNAEFYYNETYKN
jgi:hypothetical protein